MIEGGEVNGYIGGHKFYTYNGKKSFDEIANTDLIIEISTWIRIRPEPCINKMVCPSGGNTSG